MTAQWRARSRAWLTANPTCTRCPAKATICDNHAPVRPHDREVLALISDGKGRAAEFQPILDQPQAAWCDPKRLSERQFTAGIFIEHAPGNALAVIGPRENAPEGFLHAICGSPA